MEADEGKSRFRHHSLHLALPLRSFVTAEESLPTSQSCYEDETRKGTSRALYLVSIQSVSALLSYFLQVHYGLNCVSPKFRC